MSKRKYKYPNISKLIKLLEEQKDNQLKEISKKLRGIYYSSLEYKEKINLYDSCMSIEPDYLIRGIFIWYNTKEGYNYWNNVYSLVKSFIRNEKNI